MRLRRRVLAVLGALTMGAALLAVPRPVGAAGVTTHAWMALDAVDLVADPQLRALLTANLDQVEGGAQFPDSGYWNTQFGLPDGDYGEEAHWQRFFDAYADQIAADPGCGDLTLPNGPCAPRIAHVMGAMGHGIGDEVWDWLFEPRAPDFGESYIPPVLEDFFGTGGAELQMDIIAIHDHDRQTQPDTPPIPAPNDLVDVFNGIGHPGITIGGLESGKGGMSTIRLAEPIAAQLFQADIHANMPNTAAGLVDAPGGVDFAAQAIALAYENLWGRILGAQPPTIVTATYPADGETGIPATGWDRVSFQPGSAPGRGGARTRIAAALSYALPYVPRADQPGGLPAQLPAGAMTLTEVATGSPVASRAGYPKVVPYGPDSGTHTIDFQPIGNLTPCTEYRVDTTAALVDHNGASVTPAAWTFTTDGCPIAVTTGADAGDGSFRAAVAAAEQYLTPPTVRFDAGLTVDLSTQVTYGGSLPLTIEGNGSTVDVGGTSRVFAAPSATAVTVEALTVRGGRATGPGGGLEVADDLLLVDSSVVGNHATDAGGGLAVGGGLTVTNSTVGANTADGDGGGIAVGGSLTLDHATVAANQAGVGGGPDGDEIAFTSAGPQMLDSERSAIGTAGGGHDVCAATGSVTVSATSTHAADASCGLPAGGSNVEGVDPRLGPPRDNGSPTPTTVPTMFPLAGSPLIDAVGAADRDTALTVDQRGVARPAGGGCDVGAIEAVYPPHGLTDVAAWLDDSVAWLASPVNDPVLMTGFPDGTFQADLDISRAQFVRLRHRQAGSPDVSGLAAHGLTDVPPWVDDAVTWAVSTGTMTGYPDSSFRPGDPISRAQVVRAEYRTAGSPDVSGLPLLPPSSFGDVPAWVADAVRWAVHHGIMAGYPDGTFRPERSISRGQVARADYRLAITPAAWADPTGAPSTVPFVAP